MTCETCSRKAICIIKTYLGEFVNISCLQYAYEEAHKNDEKIIKKNELLRPPKGRYAECTYEEFLKLIKRPHIQDDLRQAVYRNGIVYYSGTRKPSNSFACERKGKYYHKLPPVPSPEERLLETIFGCRICEGHTTRVIINKSGERVFLCEHHYEMYERMKNSGDI